MGDTTAEKTFADGKKELREQQVWPYLLFQLSKQIGMIDNNGLTDMGNYYLNNSNWRFDQQLVTIMVMLKQNMPVDLRALSPTDEIPNPTEFNAVNLL